MLSATRSSLIQEHRQLCTQEPEDCQVQVSQGYRERQEFIIKATLRYQAHRSCS